MSEPGSKNPVLAHILAEIGGARRVLDVGCGSGALVRALVRRGCEAVGLDPQAERIAEAREKVPEARFVEGSGDALPFDDASFEAVVFLNALHHVPVDGMDRALAEAERCLAPDGKLVVVEPLADGPHFEVVRLVDDETEIRGAAQAELDRFDMARQADIRFERTSTFADEAAFVAHVLATDPARARVAEAHAAELSERLHRNATATDDGLALAQPMRLRSFRKAD